MNASLKKMLAHVSQKYPKQWHKLLPIVLWCMRESRNKTLAVSPFMMVMGRNPANPLKILKDTWTGENQCHRRVQTCRPMGACIACLVISIGGVCGRC